MKQQGLGDVIDFRRSSAGFRKSRRLFGLSRRSMVAPVAHGERKPLGRRLTVGLFKRQSKRGSNMSTASGRVASEHALPSLSEAGEDKGAADLDGDGVELRDRDEAEGAARRPPRRTFSSASRFSAIPADVMDELQALRAENVALRAGSGRSRACTIM